MTAKIFFDMHFTSEIVKAYYQHILHLIFK